MTQKENSRNVNRTLRQSLLIVVLMFGFVFALVPLYDLLCDVTGLNGKTRNQAERVDSSGPDVTRTVTVEFLGSVNNSLPWDFRPSVTRMKVHPGKMYRTSFYARNRTAADMTGQAIPSVTPGLAALHFKKTECFCFTEQKFGAGEGRDMPLLFMVDKGLPENISTLTLAYTFFEKREVVD